MCTGAGNPPANSKAAAVSWSQLVPGARRIKTCGRGIWRSVEDDNRWHGPSRPYRRKSAAKSQRAKACSASESSRGNLRRGNGSWCCLKWKLAVVQVDLGTEFVDVPVTVVV